MVPISSQLHLFWSPWKMYTENSNHEMGNSHYKVPDPEMSSARKTWTCRTIVLTSEATDASRTMRGKPELIHVAVWELRLWSKPDSIDRPAAFPSAPVLEGPVEEEEGDGQGEQESGSFLPASLIRPKPRTEERLWDKWNIGFVLNKCFTFYLHKCTLSTK